MSDFKWRHFEGEIILWAVHWYCRYGISYRDLEQMMGERDVPVDHSTIYCWIQRYAPEMEKRLRWQWRRPRSTSWQVAEAYVKVRGEWTYLYWALDTRTREVIGQTQHRHRSEEFRKSLDTIEENVPAELHIHMILDNYGTHKTALIHNWLAKRRRFHLHFTPTSASWLNLVERWFAARTDKRLRRGVHRSTKELETAIRTFIQKHNRDPMPFVWHKTAVQILDAVARFCV
jgi:transposase